MKKSMILTLTFLFAILILASYNANGFIETSYLKFNVINQNPDPVSPGGVVDLRIRVDNLGTEKADSYKYELVLDKGFEVLSDKVVSKGSIDGYQQGENGAMLYWKIKVSDSLVGSDTYTFRIKYYNDQYTFYTEPFSLRIKDVPNNIVLKNINYDFDSFKPGSEGKIVLDLKNSGSKILYSVSTKLSSEVLSFKNDVVEKEYLSPNEENSFVHDVVIKPETKPGVYNVIIQVSYVDESGVLHTKNYNSNILVFEKPDYFLTLENSDLKTKGKGKIVVSISNRGSESLKYTLISLEEHNEYYDILSSKDVYIGNLDSDDFDTAEFELYMKKTGSVPLKFKVSFKDSYGNVYEDYVNLDYKVYDFRTAELYGFKSKNNVLIIFLVLAVIISAYFFLKKRNKSKLKRLK